MTLISDSEGDSLRHLGMAKERIVHFNGTDLLTTLVDEFLDTTRDNHVSIRIFHALVTRAEESVLGEGRLVGRGVVQVPLCHVLAADADLCPGTRGDFFTCVIQDSNIHAHSDAHAAGLALRGWERVTSHLVRGLGHSVGLQNWRVECRLQVLEGLGG